MTYYLFRHGQTFATKYRRGFYGLQTFSADILEDGKPAIERLGRYLKNAPTDFNVSSKFKRCRQTVEIVSKITGKEFSFDSRLNELIIEPPWFFNRRVKNFLKEIESKNYKSVMICTHAAVLSKLVFLITGKKITFPDPGVLLIIEDKNIKAISFNSDKESILRLEIKS